MKTAHELSTCAKRKFANLITFMEQQTESRIDMTFQKLEEVIGQKLGKSYYTTRSMWLPTKHRPVGTIIFNAGYDIENLNLETQTFSLYKPVELLPITAENREEATEENLEETLEETSLEVAEATVEVLEIQPEKELPNAN